MSKNSKKKINEVLVARPALVNNRKKNTQEAQKLAPSLKNGRGDSSLIKILYKTSHN